MKRLIALSICALAAPAVAAPSGVMGTLPHGDYVCELPGDVTGPAGHRVPSEDFTVINASSYRAGGQPGSYLLVGDDLTMTSGPHRGKRYHRPARTFLRQLRADGSEGDLRCVRQIRNNR